MHRKPTVEGGRERKEEGERGGVGGVEGGKEEGAVDRTK